VEAAAIKEISRLVIESEKANRIHADGLGRKPAIIIGSSIVDTENLLAGRVRFRGAFSTQIPYAFAEYVNLAGSHGKTSVYVDPDKVTATAFLNEGNKSDPGHCDWTAKLALVATAGFSALLAINGIRASQRELSDWLEDWSAMLTPVFPDGEPSTLRRAIAAVRAITFKAKDESTHVIDDGGMIYWTETPGKTNDEIAEEFRRDYDGELGEFDVTTIATDECSVYGS
jgi:uncharacterized protein YfdQ (DUF2303 family)